MTYKYWKKIGENEFQHKKNHDVTVRIGGPYLDNDGGRDWYQLDVWRGNFHNYLDHNTNKQRLGQYMSYWLRDNDIENYIFIEPEGSQHDLTNVYMDGGKYA